MKWLDVRDTGLRGRTPDNKYQRLLRAEKIPLSYGVPGSKEANKKEIEYYVVYGYWQRSGLGHIGRRTRRSS